MSARRNRIAESVAAFEAAGKIVRGVRVYTNGTFDLLTDSPAQSLPSNDEGDWVDLAGETQVSRAAGA